MIIKGSKTWVMWYIINHSSQWVHTKCLLLIGHWAEPWGRAKGKYNGLHTNIISCDVRGQWMCGTCCGSRRGSDSLFGRVEARSPCFTSGLCSVFGITSFPSQSHSPSRESFSHQFLGVLAFLWISSPFCLFSSWDWTMEWEGCQCKSMHFRLCSPTLNAARSPCTPSRSPLFYSQEQLMPTPTDALHQPQLFCQQATSFASQRRFRSD